MNPKTVREVLVDLWESGMSDYDLTYSIDTTLNALCEIVESLTKHADSFTKDGRDRLLAVGYNSALNDIIKKIKEG